MNNKNINLATFASGIGIGLLGRFLGRIIVVLSGIIVARELGPAYFGYYAIGLIFIRLGEVVVPLGFDVGVLKYGVEINNDLGKLKGIILYSTMIAFGFGLFIGLLVYLMSPHLSQQIFKQPQTELVLRYVSIILPCIALLSILASATRISQDIKFSFATQDVGQPLFGLLFLGYFLWMGWRLEGVLLADTLSVAIATLIALYFLFKLFPFLFDKKISLNPPDPSFYKFSIVSSFSVIFGTLVFWVDRLILGIYVPSIELGVYQAAAQLSVVFAVILSGMNRIITPLFASLFSNMKMKELNEIYTIGTKWALYLGVPIFIVLFVNPIGVIEGIYGSQYRSGVVILYILLFGQLMNLLTGSVSPLLNVAGYQNRMMLFSGISLIISVALNLYLIPKYGIAGGAIATSASLGIYYAVSFLFARAKLNVWPFDKRYLKVVLATLVSTGLIILVRHTLNNVSIIYLALDLLVAYGSFYIVLFLAGLDAEDLVFLSSIKSFVRL